MQRSSPGITFFTVPRAFHGEFALAQRNAIESWMRVAPNAQVILFGDEPGVGEFAGRVGATHQPVVQRNEFGTPLFADIFRRVSDLAQHHVITYVNADIILLSDFGAAIRRIVEARFDRFLMIGRRTELKVSQPLDFAARDWEAGVRAELARKGVPASRVCKDYFAYPKPMYREVPPFAVGRGNLDNWMVFHAHDLKVPVVDASAVVTATHQSHGYAHIAGGRRAVYISGPEAKRNRDLAGGSHLIKGSAASWKLTPGGVRRVVVPIAALQLAADVVPFLRLVFELFCLNRRGPRPL